MPSTRVRPPGPWLLRVWVKPLVFMLALLPLASLLWAMYADTLGANPAQALVRATGDWSLSMLCVVLAVTPLRVVMRQPAWARFRRMLGLFVFFYVSLHLLCYSWFDMGFDLNDIIKDIGKRPFILVGFLAFVFLNLLAATSFNRAIKWLGATRWRALHRLVYAVALLAVLHFYWMRTSKNDVTEVFVYAAIIGTLLAWRVYKRLVK